MVWWVCGMVGVGRWCAVTHQLIWILTDLLHVSFASTHTYTPILPTYLYTHTCTGPIPLIIVKHVATQRDSSPSTSDGTDTSNPATLDSPQFPPLPLGEVPMSDSLSQRPKHPKTEALVSGGVTWIPFEQLKLTKKLGSVGPGNLGGVVWGRGLDGLGGGGSGWSGGWGKLS